MICIASRYTVRYMTAVVPAPIRPQDYARMLADHVEHAAFIELQSGDIYLANSLQAAAELLREQLAWHHSVRESTIHQRAKTLIG